MRRLHKNNSDIQIAGVCSGLAKFLGIDVTIIRLLFVLLFFIPEVPVVLPYIVMAIVMPD